MAPPFEGGDEHFDVKDYGQLWCIRRQIQRVLTSELVPDLPGFPLLPE